MNSNFDSFHFLGRVLSPFTERTHLSRVGNRIATGSVDWETVIAIANTHLVVSTMWHQLCEKQLDMKIEPLIRDYLRKIHALNLRRNHALKRQALEIIDCLNKKGIRPLFIKGAAQLFQPFQGDMGSRIMTDLDLWVPEHQIAAAVDALTAVGYSDGGKCLKKYHHWAPLFRKGEYGAVELHHEVLPAGIAQVLNGLEISNASQDLTLQGLHFRVPTPTHAVLLGILHSQVKDNFHFEWAIGLKPLNDVVAMMSCFSGAIDWEEIGSRVNRHGLGPILRTFMLSAHRLFDLPLPSGLQPTLGAFAHHTLCMAAIHWKAVDQFMVKTGRYHRYIYRRLGGRKIFFRHNAGSFSPAV